MDGNGNKVQTLRHQFEARHVSPHENQRQDASSGLLNASATAVQLQRNDPRYHLAAENKFMPSISAKNISSLYGSGGNTHPVSVLSELGSQPSRSGVYVSNSITLYDDLPTARQELMLQNDEFLDDNSSQNSSALYGKVKRRNAFRQKDGADENAIDTPRSREKLSLERVRSLEDSPRRIPDIDINRARSVYVKRQNPQEDQSGGARLNSAPQPHRAIRTVSDYVLTSQKDSFPYSYNSSACYNSDVPPPVPPPPSFYEPYWRQARNVSSTERPLSIMSDSQNLQLYSDAPREPPPPEKPPRTFLYDMFTDQVLQPTDVYSKDCKGTSAVAMTRRGTLPTTGITSPNQYSDASPSERQQIYGLVPAILNLNISPTSTSAASSSSKRSSSHPGLTRSKTESEIIVKPKLKSSGQSIAATGNEYQANVNAPPYYPSSREYPTAPTDSRNTHRPSAIPQDGRQAASNRHGYYGDIYGGSDVSTPDSFQNTSRHTQIQQHIPHYGKVIPTNDYSARATAMQTAGQSYSMLPRFPESAIPLPISKKRGTLPIMPNQYGVGNRMAYIEQMHRQEERLHEKSKSDWALNNAMKDERNYRTVLTTGGNINVVKGVRSAQKLQRSHQTTSQPCFPSSYQYGQQKPSNKPYAPTIKEATASTDSGIQLGSDSLCSCDTPLGDSTTDTGESDPENEEISYTARQVVEARKGYIRHVSSFRKDVGQAPARILPQTKKTPRIVDRLFECLVVVGLNRDANTGSYKPYVKELYPPEIELPSGIEQFCFPDATDWPCYEGETAQSYTLAITDHYGRRKYGYCCRILPEGANICIPITYCLISTHRAIGFYMLILKEITKRHGNSESLRRSWIDQLYNNIFPPPDGEVQVKEPIEEEYIYGSRSRGALISSANTLRTISMRRRADNRLDDNDLVSLLTQLDVSTVLKIFGSILHERKVVLLGRALKTLSLCIEALESILHPFTWQHTFIPLLPLNMPDILDAPSPFLIGVLKMQDTVWDKRLDDGMIVDIDANKIVQCVGDEATILPKRIHRKLKDSLQCILTLPGQDSSSKNVLFSECFIRMFVDVLGHYGQHIVMQADGSKMFDRDSFLKATDSKAIQNFLDWFSETSMFHDFIESRLISNAKPGVFERRIMGDQSKQSYGAPFKNKTYRGHKTFGINWLKDAFILK